MAFTHHVTRSYTDSSGGAIGATENITDDTELNFDGTFATGTTNGEIDWTSTVANLKSILIYSDKAVTLKTNSSGSPQETIPLTAGQALIWVRASDGAGHIPFAGDVTKIFITNSSGATCAFKIRALAHQTV